MSQGDASDKDRPPKIKSAYSEAFSGPHGENATARGFSRSRYPGRIVSSNPG